jgi:RimJ/RimL family protein N-acetyltransferase
MPQPILRTARLLLVPLADRHLELEVELDSDPEVHRFLNGRALTRDEVIASHRRRMALAAQVDGLGYWAAYVRDADASPPAPDAEEDGEFAGVMFLPPAHGEDQPHDPTVCDLGYRLLRRFWRKGLASEASLELLAHAFDTVGQRRVIAQTMAVNAASRGVMEKVGMRYVRTFHPHFDDPLPGAEEGEVDYQMTREMWEQLKGGPTPSD